NILVEQLYMCVEFLWKSERYELIADVNKPIIAVFEKQRDFKKLSDLYYDIHRSYLKVAEVVNSEKRLFGRYYRVAFYGQVNAGPMAYARAFLEETNAKKYPDNQVKLLKEIFRQFADACGQALDVNERLIKEDQLEYQEELRSHYKDMLSELSTIMNEQVSIPWCDPQFLAIARGTEDSFLTEKVSILYISIMMLSYYLPHVQQLLAQSTDVPTEKEYEN
ncbi:hypothetical protein A6R68_15992, partial [Neotoma lepida]